jgi:hypothetical protein
MVRETVILILFFNSNQNIENSIDIQSLHKKFLWVFQVPETTGTELVSMKLSIQFLLMAFKVMNSLKFFAKISRISNRFQKLLDTSNHQMQSKFHNKVLKSSNRNIAENEESPECSGNF